MCYASKYDIVKLISDASGQINTQDMPGRNTLTVPLRSSTILKARLRISQFREIDARLRSSLLKGLMFLHLKKDLEAHPLDWIGCELPSEKTTKKNLTSYNINTEYQECLSNIRTDFDAFSEVEAHALMTSGYLMTETMLEQDRHIRGFADCICHCINWGFLRMQQRLGSKVVDPALLEELGRASKNISGYVRLCLMPLRD
ncbi:patatin family protein [Candidatus Magnetobacterium bavaricum]|uniref:Patatin family protein n=1 Tax=Candidatus Magnetobacterium bavaricum TaxID=29290 RepID=A0A0F3GQ64_9BACT|nr:patatin family protein [Candidatus Magnetobacterium bavaricum]